MIMIYPYHHRHIIVILIVITIAIISLITPRVVEGRGIGPVNEGRLDLLRQLWCCGSVKVVGEPFFRYFQIYIFF